MSLDKNEKRVRARHMLAECLSSDDVRRRMRDEAHKQEKRLKKDVINPKVLSTKTTVLEVVFNAR